MTATIHDSRLTEARERLDETLRAMQEWGVQLDGLPSDAAQEMVDAAEEGFQKAKRDHELAQKSHDRLKDIADAYAANRTRTDETTKVPAGESVVKHGPDADERTYTERSSRQGVSFFRDLRNSVLGDSDARERLSRHTKEIAIDRRDLTTTVTAGGNFVPPVYLGELYAGKPRAGRPFADVVPKQPLMSSGMSITIPRITTGTTATIQGTHGTQNQSVSETDIVEALLTVNVRTIAGQQDVSQQLFDRSEPGIDQILFEDLRSAYDTSLDSQLLNGAGTFGTHLGVRSVSSVNTVTYTDSSPTAAETHPKIYDAIQKVATNRYMDADTIVMHPRRAAFLASNLSSTFPLYQQGQLNQAGGTQDVGMLTSFAGMRVVLDANVRTTDGSSTNQDEIYVMRVADMILWEGPLQARVLPEVGSGTLTVRIQLFGYSAFASGRHPASITVISGTGLTVPSF